MGGHCQKPPDSLLSMHVSELSDWMGYPDRPMKRAITRRSILLTLALLSASVSLAYGDNDTDHDNDSDDDDDHDRASRAVAQGRALPLAAILNRVGGLLGGEVIGVEFKRKDGRLVYRFKVATPTGKLREVSVDAMTGEIVKSKED
jgi:uncharacterized membrane protein YkoI